MAEVLSGSEMNEQGILWYKAGNFAEAKKCWDISAGQGNANSMFCLGILSLSAGRNDVAEARMWFEKAARAGHKNAKYQLSHLKDGAVRSRMAEKILFQRPDTFVDIPLKTKEFGGYEWLVLKEIGEKALYLSKDIIDIRKYHSVPEGVTWETSHIRKWLNSEFYNRFSLMEKNSICDNYCENRNNPMYGTEGGEDTFDKCFLLSYEEVTGFFEGIDKGNQSEDLLSSGENNISLMAKVNMSNEELEEAHRRSGLDYSMVNGQSLGWWLRTPGSDEKRAVRINCNGAIRLHGRETDRNLVGVRPAMWVKKHERKKINCISNGSANKIY